LSDPEPTAFEVQTLSCKLTRLNGMLSFYIIIKSLPNNCFYSSIAVETVLWCSICNFSGNSTLCMPAPHKGNGTICRDR